VKVLKWATKLIVQTCLIGIICSFATLTTIQWYVGELLKQFHLAEQVNAVKPSDLLGRWSQGIAGIVLGKADSKKDQENENPAATQSGETNRQSEPAVHDDNNSSSGKDASASEHDDAVAVWNQTSGAGADGLKTEDAFEQNKKVVISSEDVAKKKDAISNEDKMKLFALLANRLPQSEMQHISKIAEDGITASEIKELERIVSTYLKPEEYAQLMEILHKY